MALSVEQQTIITATMNASGYVTPAQKVAAANKEMAASGEVAVSTTAKLTKALLEGRNAYERFALQLDTSIRAANSYDAVINRMAKSHQNGWSTLSQVNAVLGVAAEKYAQVTAASSRTIEQLTTLSAANSARAAQQARAMDATAREIALLQNYGASLDKVRASYNPLFAAAQQFTLALARVDDAQQKQAITAREAGLARDRETAAYRAAIAAHREYAASLGGTIGAKTLSGIDDFEAAGLDASKIKLMRSEFAKGMAPPKPPLEDLDALKARYDRLTDASNRYLKALSDIDKLAQAGLVNPSQAKMMRERAGEDHPLSPKNTAKADDDLEGLKRKWDSLYAASMRYAEAVEDIDRLQARGAVSPARAQFLKDQAAQEHLAPGKMAVEKEKTEDLDKLRMQYDSIYAASKRYERALADIEKLESSGTVKAATAERLREAAATDHLTETTKRAGKEADKTRYLTGGAIREMLVLGHESLFGYYSRIPGSLWVLMERFGAMEKIMGHAKQWLVTPFAMATVAITATVAAMALLGYYAEVNERRLNTLRDRLSGIRTDSTAMASAVDSSARSMARDLPGVYRDDALAAAQSFAQQPNFHGGAKQLATLGALTLQLSRALGEDFTEAAKKMAESFSDPVKATQDMIGHLRGFDQALVDTVKAEEALHGKDAATVMFLNAVRQAADQAGPTLTRLQTALHDLYVEFKGTKDRGVDFAHALGGLVDAGAAVAIETLTGLLRDTREMYNLIKGLVPGLPNIGSGPSFSDALRLAINPLGTVIGGIRTAQPNVATGDPGGIPVYGPNVHHQVHGQMVDERAVGAFQVLPSTAAGMGMSETDIATIGGNVTAGINDLVQKFVRAGGNLSPQPGMDQSAALFQAIKGYSGNSTDAGAAGYLAKVKAASPDAVDPAVKAAIDAALATRQLPPELEGLIRRIPMVESRGGRQYQNPGAGMVGPEAGPGRTGSSTGSAGLNANDLGTGYDSDQRQQDAAAARETMGLLTRQRQANLEAQQKQEAAMKDAAGSIFDPAKPNSAKQYAEAYEALQKLRGEMTNLITAQEMLARSATDATHQLSAEAGAAREMAAVRQQFEEASRASGQPIDQVALQAALAAKQMELTTAANDATAAMNRQSDGEARLIALHEAGGATLEHAINREHALIEARKTAEPGTAEYRRQVDAITAALDRQGRIKRDIAAAEDIRRLREEIQFISEETRLLTASVEVRTRELAILRARQSLHLAPGQKPTGEEQKKLDLAGQEADRQTQLMKTEDSLNELESSTSRIADTIGNGLQEAFHKGRDGAQSLKDTAVTVLKEIEAQLIKLAIINPIMNALFPQNHRQTIGDMGDAISRQWGGGKDAWSSPGGGNGSGNGSNDNGSNGSNGSGSNSSSIFGGAGLLGNLINKVGGAGFYQGGGLIGKLFGGGSSAASSMVDTGTWDLGSAASGAIGGSFAMHSGGLVGTDGSPRSVPAYLFAGAPRYHSGLNNDEFATILQRGERVLTANQNNQATGQLRAAASGGGGGTVNHHWNITTPDADSFRSSRPQLTAKFAAAMGRTNARNSMT